MHGEQAFAGLAGWQVEQRFRMHGSGLQQRARAGCIVIDMATISPLATRRIAQALAARGIEHIDAPVSGGPAGAQGQRGRAPAHESAHAGVGDDHLRILDVSLEFRW